MKKITPLKRGRFRTQPSLSSGDVRVKRFRWRDSNRLRFTVAARKIHATDHRLTIRAAQPINDTLEFTRNVSGKFQNSKSAEQFGEDISGVSPQDQVGFPVQGGGVPVDENQAAV